VTIVIDRLFDCSLVLFSMTLVYLAPTFAASRFFLPRRGVADTVLCALALGVSSQAVIGSLWRQVIGGRPGLEPLLYLAVWVILTAAALRRGGGGPAGPKQTDPWRLLLAVIVAGMALRLVYPLANVALGQSDAYSHLQFLEDIVTSGRLRNPTYPSGYHWVLALPCLLFRVDPYLLARYGGAFFGGLLIGGTFLLARSGGGRRAGLTAALLVAVFPGFMPLIKTGVGAFANQMGLLLIPFILREYLLAAADEGRNRRGRLLLMAAFLAGLAASVPLMALHAAIFIALERVAALFRERASWTARSAVLVLPLLPAALIIVLHTAQVPEKTRERVTNRVTAESARKAARAAEGKAVIAKKPPDSLRLARDFFTVKRLGLGSPVLNAAAAVLLAAFSFLLLRGIRAGEVFRTGIGLWGIFALTRTVTGFLEFSAYQRSGWTLTLAAAVLGGIIYRDLEGHLEGRVTLAPLSCLGGAAMACWAFLVPPRHVHVMSSAETEIVGVARSLAQDERFSKARWISFENLQRTEVNGLLDPSLRLTVVTRNFSTMRAKQGNMAAAALGRAAGIRVREPSRKRALRGSIREDSQYLFLIDRPVKLSSRDLGLAGRMNPGFSRMFSRWQFSLYGANDQLRDLVDDLQQAGRRVSRTSMGPNLEIIAVLPPVTVRPAPAGTP
jgi:hypothetical protein